MADFGEALTQASRVLTVDRAQAILANNGTDQLPTLIDMRSF